MKQAHLIRLSQPQLGPIRTFLQNCVRPLRKVWWARSTFFAAHGVTVRGIREVEPALEDVFVALVHLAGGTGRED